jgi:hypothetical protein
VGVMSRYERRQIVTVVLIIVLLLAVGWATGTDMFAAVEPFVTLLLIMVGVAVALYAIKSYLR